MNRKQEPIILPYMVNIIFCCTISRHLWLLPYIENQSFLGDNFFQKCELYYWTCICWTLLWSKAEATKCGGKNNLLCLNLSLSIKRYALPLDILFMQDFFIIKFYFSNTSLIWKVLAKFTEMTTRYTQEMQTVCAYVGDRR
jgi:hypothetical protein